MIFENIFIYYNDKSRLFKRRNVGILEVSDTELKLYHSGYTRTINYDDITSIELKGGIPWVNIDWVSITLKNGDFYNLKYLFTNIYEKKEAIRKTKLLLGIIDKRMSDPFEQKDIAKRDKKLTHKAKLDLVREQYLLHTSSQDIADDLGESIVAVRKYIDEIEDELKK